MLKGEKRDDCTRTALNMQPSDLRSNAYRSLPGAFSLQVLTGTLENKFLSSSTYQALQLKVEGQ